MYERISELVSFLDGAQAGPILLVGDFMLDEYLYGDAERISPEAPVPVVRVRNRELRLGGAGSGAASLLGLGCATYCGGIIGSDEAGDKIRSELEQAGAETSCLLTSSSVSTPLKQRLVGLAQHRIRQQLLRVDHESACGGPDEEALLELRDCIKKVLPKVKLVALEDYDKGLLASGLSQWFIDRAKDLSLPVIVDPAGVADYSRYRGAHLVTPNRLEASLAAGIEIDSVDRAREAARTLRERYAIEFVAVTLDRDGIFLAGPDFSEHVPTERREVFDNTGAGDVVLATLAVSLARGLDLPAAAALANVAGGWEIQQQGAVPITREQLQYELLSRHRSHRGKLVTRAQLLRELRILRQQDKRIAFTNGCFDLLHPGHISIFEFARSQGDVLVVGLNSDRSVRELKGPSRPLINQRDRARMIAALEAVDYVTIFDETSVLPLVEEVRPDVLVKGRKGRDSKPDGVVGYDFVLGYGGRVVLASIDSEYSTTGVINTIIARTSEELAKGGLQND